MGTNSDLESFTEAARAGSEACRSIFQTTFDSGGELLAYNADWFRTLCQLSSQPFDRLDVGGAISAQVQQLERASGYIREINAIFVKTQGELVRLGAGLADELTRNAAAQLGSLVETSPFLTGGFAEAMKASLTDAGDVCGRMVDASRQAADASMASILASPPPAAPRASIRGARKTA